MTETLVQGIIDALGGSVGKELIVFLISMIPILELRGALLVAGPLLGVPVTTAIPLRRERGSLSRWWISWNQRL